MKTLQVNKGGRPTIYGEEIVKKLESAYQLGVSDEIASNYAGISKVTLYKWRETYPELVNRLDGAKHYARMAAGAVVVQAIKDKDVNTAKWWLEKKYPQEFGTQPQVLQQFNTGEGGITYIIQTTNDNKEFDGLTSEPVKDLPVQETK